MQLQLLREYSLAIRLFELVLSPSEACVRSSAFLIREKTVHSCIAIVSQTVRESNSSHFSRSRKVRRIDDAGVELHKINKTFLSMAVHERECGHKLRLNHSQRRFILGAILRFVRVHSKASGFADC